MSAIRRFRPPSLAWLGWFLGVLAAAVVVGLLALFLLAYWPAADGPDPGGVVGFASAVSWPLVALIAFLLFRKPLSRFLSQNFRTVKLAVLQVSVEASVASGGEREPTLDVAGIRDMTLHDLTKDDRESLLRAFGNDRPQDYIIVDIGAGKDPWYTSRLFLVAAMLEQMSGLRCLVFVESTPQKRMSFLGTASPSDVRWRLASLYPWLESSFAKALFIQQYWSGRPEMNELDWDKEKLSWRKVVDLTAKRPNRVTSDAGRIDEYQAKQILGFFLLDSNMRQPSSSFRRAEGDDTVWVEVRSTSRRSDQGPDSESYWEHAETIDRAWLDNLGDVLKRDDDAFVRTSPDDPQTELARAILRRKHPFVALVDDEKQFKSLVDRQSLLEDVGARLLKQVTDADP